MQSSGRTSDRRPVNGGKTYWGTVARAVEAAERWHKFCLGPVVAGLQEGLLQSIQPPPNNLHSNSERRVPLTALEKNRPAQHLAHPVTDGSLDEHDCPACLDGNICPLAAPAKRFDPIGPLPCQLPQPAGSRNPNAGQRTTQSLPRPILPRPKPVTPVPTTSPTPSDLPPAKKPRPRAPPEVLARRAHRKRELRAQKAALRTGEPKAMGNSNKKETGSSTLGRDALETTGPLYSAPGTTGQPPASAADKRPPGARDLPRLSGDDELSTGAVGSSVKSGADKLAPEATRRFGALGAGDLDPGAATHSPLTGDQFWIPRFTPVFRAGELVATAGKCFPVLGADALAAGSATHPSVTRAKGLPAGASDGSPVTGAEGPPAGSSDGSPVTGAEGLPAGASDGSSVTGAEGPPAGSSDGSPVTGAEGLPAGASDGSPVTGAEGPPAGASDGSSVTGAEGLPAGASDGSPVTGAEGLPAGASDGSPVTGAEGLPAGASDGSPVTGAEGLPAGASDGSPVTAAEGLPARASDAFPVTGAEELPAGASSLPGVIPAGCEGHIEEDPDFIDVTLEKPTIPWDDDILLEQLAEPLEWDLDLEKYWRMQAEQTCETAEARMEKRREYWRAYSKANREAKSALRQKQREAKREAEEAESGVQRRGRGRSRLGLQDFACAGESTNS
jgi:hypothetical protein